jgi:hypothetical protein
MLHIPTYGLSYINLFGEGEKVLIAEGHKITTSAVHIILKNYLAVDSNIEHLGTIFDTVEAWRDYRVSSTISLCSDNSGFIQNVGE